MNDANYHVPDHTLKETEKEIIIVIIAPLSKPKEVAFVLEKNVFSFESPPYHLKIKLPHSVSDRFSQQGYDSDSKTYKIKLKKIFESHQDTQEDMDVEEGEISQSDVFRKGDNTITESTQNEESKQFYGFANKYSNIFGKLYNEFSEVISLPNPDYTIPSERRNLRLKEENEKWSDDHFLADTMETDHLESIFKYEPPWITSPLKDDFNNDEKEMLLGLIDYSKIEKLSKEYVKLSEFQIVDILFGYAYNKRTTEGDNTVESGWTINKLSSTLSWFEIFEELKSLLTVCYRRALIFPLFRNWDLANTVHMDVCNILKTGFKQVTRCLLEVREIFNESENRYILNSLYINDLCNFAYHMTTERCLKLSEEIHKVQIKKHEVNSDLPLLEIAARLTLEESKGGDNTESDVKKIVDKIVGLNLGCKNSSSSDSSESDSDSSDSSQSSDTED